MLPAAHALYEWNIYIPAYGEVIQSLAFTPLGRHPRDACLKKGYDPGALLEVHETLHQRLGRRGVRSVQFSHANYAGSAYNRVASAGAEVVVHGTPAEALVQLKEALLQTSGKALLSFYWAAIDTMAHIHGPGTAYHAAEIASYWHTFDAVMRDIDSPDTLYLFIADHGQVQTDARETIYLNERVPELAACLPVSPTGNTIYPERRAARRLPAPAPRAQGRGAGPAAPEFRRRRAHPADRGRARRRACSARAPSARSCGGGSATC